MNLVLDEAEEISRKKESRRALGRILLKGDNITLMRVRSEKALPLLHSVSGRRQALNARKLCLKRAVRHRSQAKRSKSDMSSAVCLEK